MSEIKVILNNGTEHIVPEANLENVQRVLGHNIKKIVKIGGSSEQPKINRAALESVVKRELKWTDAKLKKASDQDLLNALK